MDPEERILLEHLDDGQKEIIRRLDELNGSVSDILLELGGVPHSTYREHGRRTIRSRLHALENDKAAALAAKAAIESAERFYNAASARRFSRAEKLVGLAFASILAFSALVTLILILARYPAP